MTSKFSAYLSIFNDWDILPESLRSIAAHVDELIVVDGAYDWMVPYLTALGLDPTRSDARVYAAVEASGIPFRVISRTWRNEIEKRQFGYEACTHDYIYRVDADEIMFFDDTALESALSCGLAVGEMEMPTYAAPGWLSCPKGVSRIGRQCFLFDRRQVSSEIHLNYLWLILTIDALPMAGIKPFVVFPEPLAFNAHLTEWRTPRTGVNRAAFYILNWMRQNGIPWLPALRNRPLTSVQTLFDTVCPGDFVSSLSRGRIAFGMAEDPSKRSFLPSPLSSSQEATFTNIYARFLTSLAEMNIQASTEEQPFLTCLPTLLDMSTPAACSAIAGCGHVRLKMSVPLLSAKAQILTYATGEAGGEVHDLPVKLEGTELHFALPEMALRDARVLRQCIEFHVWPDSQDLSHRFQVLT